MALTVALPLRLPGQLRSGPDTVIVRAGTLTLHGLLWRPTGRGPFPAILFNHGSHSAGDTLRATEPLAIGPVFARHGYVFLFLLRRGVGLSADQGQADGDLMNSAFSSGGQEARDRIQLELLDGEQLNEAFAGLAFLRALTEVDAKRIGVVGHSFGGSLTILMAARDPGIRAAVVFSGAGYSWNLSSALRNRLMAAVGHTTTPIFFNHAANDYSTAPGTQLASEMERLHRPHLLKIYPPFGSSPREAHSLVYRSVVTWEADVFGFLGRYLHP